MDNLKVVVIGGVACGPKAAARLKRLNPNAQVTLIEKGEWISYGGCGLPYYVGATVKEIDDLMTTSWEAVRTPEFMKATKDIDTLLGYEAIKIDRQKKEVKVQKVGTNEIKTLAYDKLVLATGSENVIPPIKGVEGKGVFEMKTPEDGTELQDYLKSGIEHAVIVGSGLIGMEVMEACANWGIDVTVIEMMDQIFPKLLDSDLALVLQDYLESEDIQFKLNTKVEEILLDDAGVVKGVRTSDGEIDCQLVLMATGVRSDVKLAKEAGIECNPAVIVNKHMQTSDPDIYAGGDCVMVQHRISGELTFAPMGSTANKHGRIIAIFKNFTVCLGQQSLSCSIGLQVKWV
ncbi:MAG: FAD-dependent oxidoreductase [Vagococcus sp.]|nr:FAD-dependent oxidoreductase [Vagococcus sp.]